MAASLGTERCRHLTLDNRAMDVQASDMSNDLPEVTFASLIEGFMHPPARIRIDQRRDTPEGQVTVLSHLELWSWRVVLRGAVADKRALDSEPIALERETMPDEASGSISVGVLSHARLGANNGALRHALSWSISDDVGTEYRRVGATRSGGPRWSDFDVTFEPPVPKHAGRVSIVSPDGVTIDLEMTSD